MNQPTPSLLIRQRNFFLSAIALTILPALVIFVEGYFTWGMDPEVNNGLASTLGITNSVINVLTTLALGMYGIYMGSKGYLKKYVVYAFAIWLLAYVCRTIIWYIPEFQAVYSQWSNVDKSLYHGAFGILAWIVIIFSVKASAMSRWMKWTLSLGYLLMDSAALKVFSFQLDNQLVGSNFWWAYLHYATMIGEYLIAAALVQIYYSRRIKKETADIIA